MKKIYIPLTIFLLVCFTQNAVAQRSVSEKNLLGTWKLVIDLEKEFDEAQEEMDDEESIIGDLVLNSVSGLVQGVLERVDIYMQFREDGELKVMVDAFGEKETEYSEWKIKNGRLFISDNDHFSSDDDDYWLMDDDLLILFEEVEGRNENVYMVRIDK